MFTESLCLASVLLQLDARTKIICRTIFPETGGFQFQSAQANCSRDSISKNLAPPHRKNKKG
jgi:hypothetical protein